jgi:hypothetical protein
MEVDSCTLCHTLKAKITELTCGHKFCDTCVAKDPTNDEAIKDENGPCFLSCAICDNGSVVLDDSTAEDIRNKKVTFESLCSAHNKIFQQQCLDCNVDLCNDCDKEPHKSHTLKAKPVSINNSVDKKEIGEYRNNFRGSYRGGYRGNLRGSFRGRGSYRGRYYFNSYNHGHNRDNVYNYGYNNSNRENYGFRDNGNKDNIGNQIEAENDFDSNKILVNYISNKFDIFHVNLLKEKNELIAEIDKIKEYINNKATDYLDNVSSSKKYFLSRFSRKTSRIAMTSTIERIDEEYERVLKHPHQFANNLLTVKESVKRLRNELNN